MREARTRWLPDSVIPLRGRPRCRRHLLAVAKKSEPLSKRDKVACQALWHTHQQRMVGFHCYRPRASQPLRNVMPPCQWHHLIQSAVNIGATKATGYDLPRRDIA